MISDYADSEYLGKLKKSELYPFHLFYIVPSKATLN